MPCLIVPATFLILQITLVLAVVFGMVVYRVIVMKLLSLVNFMHFP